MSWEIALPDPLPKRLARFPVVVAHPVQWGDMDALGHVNNVVPIRWFETGRVAVLNRAGMAESMSGARLGPILASVRCDYLRQLHYPDTVLIASRVAQFGRSSLTIEHAIYSLRREYVTAEGASVVVVFDYQSQRPVRVPDEFRAALLRLQPGDPPLDSTHGRGSIEETSR